MNLGSEVKKEVKKFICNTIELLVRFGVISIYSFLFCTWFDLDYSFKSTVGLLIIVECVMLYFKLYFELYRK